MLLWYVVTNWKMIQVIWLQFGCCVYYRFEVKRCNLRSFDPKFCIWHIFDNLALMSCITFTFVPFHRRSWLGPYPRQVLQCIGFPWDFIASYDGGQNFRTCPNPLWESLGVFLWTSLSPRRVAAHIVTSYLLILLNKLWMDWDDILWRGPG